MFAWQRATPLTNDPLYNARKDFQRP